ncbi:MAG: CDP-diacylglycerol--serine O-phosphatidyltransferase [Niabella sp.]
MKQIPNLFTLLNLFFGCIAIVCIMEYTHRSDVLDLSFLALMLGSVYIFIAAIVDFLDGFVARLFKATSAMGEQLDSLADVVSFGVAPSMIIFKLLEAYYEQNPINGEIMWFLIPAFILPCAAAWRLAKFNLDKEQHYYFKGVPTPAGGLVVASLPLAASDSNIIDNALTNPYVLYTIVIVISILMVSNIPMISLKFKSKKVKDNLDKIIMALIAVISAVFFQWAAVPIVFICYVIVSLIFQPQKA